MTRPSTSDVRGDRPVIADGSWRHTAIVYGLVDPREPRRVRYVGATRQHPEARLHGHIAGDAGWAKLRWIAQLRHDGVHPVMVLLEVVPDYGLDLVARERAWYEELVRTGEADLNGQAPPETAANIREDRRRRQWHIEAIPSIAGGAQ